MQTNRVFIFMVLNILWIGIDIMAFNSPIPMLTWFAIGIHIFTLINFKYKLLIKNRNDKF